MLKKGDFVMSAANGICEISDIVTMNMSGTAKEYYLLIPMEEKTAKVYIPLDKAESRIRPVLTKTEARDIIDEIPNIEEVWVNNDKEREQIYKAAINSKEPRRLISIIKTLYHRMQERIDAGKKCTAVDERYFRMAENQLHAELAFALEIEKQNVKQMIIDYLNG